MERLVFDVIHFKVDDFVVVVIANGDAVHLIGDRATVWAKLCSKQINGHFVDLKNFHCEQFLPVVDNNKRRMSAMLGIVSAS
tara:strand:+ start:693 stop:938 length:246 start_codon:yes stop_codon:yes gene_type:complete